MSSGPILSEGKIPTYTSQRELIDERANVKATFCPQDGKLCLKADESQVGQRHENVKRKWQYYYNIIFSDWTWE